MQRVNSHAPCARERSRFVVAARIDRVRARLARRARFAMAKSEFFPVGVARAAATATAAARRDRDRVRVRSNCSLNR